MSTSAESSESATNPSTVDASSRLKNILYSVLLMGAVACFWTAGTQFARETYIPGQFEAPFLVTYITTGWLILFYPIYMAIRFAYKKRQNKPIQEFRCHVRLYYTDGERHTRQYIGFSALFCILWSLIQFTYIRALDPKLLSPTGVAALYSTYHSFVYLLSWIVLFDKFVAIRILAMIFSISGMVLSAYAGGFGSTSMWGVILSVAASATMSVFKVLYKKFLGTPNYGQISFFTSLIGVGNVLCIWPVTLPLCLTKTELITFEFIPWGYITGSSISICVLHLLLHYVETALYGVFTGLGFLLGIFMNAFVDYIWRDINFSGMEIAAVILSSFGILLVSLPDQCPTDFSTVTWCRWRKRCDVRGTAPPQNDTHGSRWRRTTKT